MLVCIIQDEKSGWYWQQNTKSEGRWRQRMSNASFLTEEEANEVMNYFAGWFRGRRNEPVPVVRKFNLSEVSE
jgi:hypothetical protein